MAGARCSTHGSRAIAARPSGAYYAAMRPSRSRMCMSTWRRRASLTRFVCPPTRCSRRRSRRSSRGPWAPALRPTLLRELPLSGAELEPVASRRGEGGVAPRRAVPARGLDRHEPASLSQEGRCLLQWARDVRATDQGRRGRDQVDAAVVQDVRCQFGSSFMRSPTISAVSCALWQRRNRSRIGR
jgi:hypothetical protein